MMGHYQKILREEDKIYLHDKIPEHQYSSPPEQ